MSVAVNNVFFEADAGVAHSGLYPRATRLGHVQEDRVLENQHSVSPRVSVIIPCFNLGRYLPEAITSVRHQTFSDFEIVVVDDGSTDSETLAVLASSTGPDLRVVRSSNRGLSAARNLGI